MTCFTSLNGMMIPHMECSTRLMGVGVIEVFSLVVVEVELAHCSIRSGLHSLGLFWNARYWGHNSNSTFLIWASVCFWAN